MSVINAIAIGFAWAQELTLADGMIDAGDGLRAEFRYAPEDVAPIFSIASGGGGIAIAGVDVSLTVSKTKSALIRAPRASAGWRDVFVDLVKVPVAGDEQHLGFRLKIPAVLPVTRAAT